MANIVTSYIPYTQIVSLLDILPGDTLLVSSATKRLAGAAKANNETFDVHTFIHSLMDAVGENGTLLFPTFNWDFCGGTPFNYHTTPSKTGILGTEALKMKEFRRTRHPVNSFAVWGKDQELLCDMENLSAYGKDSPFAYLHKKGKNLLIDVEMVHSVTFTHYVEECLDVPYRYLKAFTANYTDADGKTDLRTYYSLVRDLDMNTLSVVDPLGYTMEAAGKLIRKNINGVEFSTYKFSDFYDFGKKDILENKAREMASFNGQENDISGEMYHLAEKLFPICRSLTGDGVRESLKILQNIVPSLTIHEVPSGTQAFDWTIPQEWAINDAYIEDLNGNRIISFSDNNLHVVGYSAPMDQILSREDLLKIIHTQPEQPEVIPYVTSYYKKYSGFCMSANQKLSLSEDQYHAVIDSELFDGALTYGEILIPGESEKELFFATYICHPSMANNELSGPCVSIFLAKELLKTKRKYSYRFVFLPETIGAITYLSKHLQHMQEKVIAGFNLSCVGDNRTYSYIESRYGNTLADKVAKNILSFHYPEYKHYSFLQRGSDERQYCSPGVDLPVCSICRSKFNTYPEYHTSADNLELISPAGLNGSYNVYWQCIQALEHNEKYKITCLCEPQLGKRGLYPTLSQKGSYNNITDMMNFMAYADGTNDLIDISNIIKVPVKELIHITQMLLEHGLITYCNI